MDNRRAYHLSDGLHMTVYAHPKACIFCEHCTDIFYDWHGIYALVCTEGKDVNRGSAGECEDFVEEKGEDDG